MFRYNHHISHPPIIETIEVTAKRFTWTKRLQKRRSEGKFETPFGIQVIEIAACPVPNVYGNFNERADVGNKECPSWTFDFVEISTTLNDYDRQLNCLGLTLQGPMYNVWVIMIATLLSIFFSYLQWTLSSTYLDF